MVNYAVNDWTSSVGPLVDVIAELETQLETIDNTKTIIAVGAIPISNDNAQAFLITTV